MKNTLLSLTISMLVVPAFAGVNQGTDNRVFASPDQQGHNAAGYENMVGSRNGSSNIFGENNAVAGLHANAFGGGNIAVGEYTQSIGDINVAAGDYAVSVGVGNNADAEQTLTAKDPFDGSTYINRSTGNRTSVFGISNKTTADDATAIGKENNISGSGSTALGRNNIITGEESLVLGHGSSAAGNGSVAIGNASEADADNVVSIGSASNQRKLINLAAGTAATDAVNVKQLKDTAADTLTASKAYTDGKITAAGNTAKQYTDSKAAETLTSANTYTDSKVTGITDTAKQYTDTKTAETLSSANSYTDKRFSEQQALNDYRFANVSSRIDKLDKKLSAGIASSYALSAIPQTITPGGAHLGAGIGAYGSASALAIGYSQASENGRVIFKAGVTTGLSSAGNSRIGAQAGISFKLN